MRVEKSPILLLLGILLFGCAAETEPNESTTTKAETKAAEVTAPLLAWSFEPASADCNGWMVKGAVAIRSIPAHSGSYSCKLCADGSASEITLTRDLGPVSAGRYALSAFVRKRANVAAPAVASAKLEAGDAAADASIVSIREEWDAMKATLDVATNSEHAKVTIGSPLAAENECLFVDDVRVERLP